jgi:hypothetical protein
VWDDAESEKEEPGVRNDGQNYKKMTGATVFLDHVETSYPLH